ncbi:MAG: hypothetical protein MRY83_07315, partial [Flavobacteriales bacterium]|nr:hypothetical protein [Flavobacteriales bacterium]
ILVIVVALVAAGFIFKDKIAAMMGGAVKEKVEDAMNSEEATNNDSEPAGEVKPDLSPEEQAKLDSMEAILDGETPTDDGNESDAETAVEAAGAAGLGK